MEYILFHKDKKVANIEFTEAGIYERVNGYYNEKIMPPGTRYADDSVIHKKFSMWLESRFFPQNRNNRTRVLNLADCVKVEQLINKGYALSLNDGYWIKNVNMSELKPFWEDINFFDNPSNGFVADILLFNKVDKNNINFISPDLTTSGDTEKGWYYEDGKYVLYKLGEKEYDYIDAANEVISSKLCQMLGIKSANYTLVQLQEGVFYTKCECFNDKNTEFFPFSTISLEKDTVGKNGILNFIEQNGLKHELDRYLIHDYILSVQDRDFTNIGFLRDIDTFEIKGLAPLYGSGHSLWYDYKKHGIGVLDEARTFDFSHSHQIQLVDDFSGIDFDDLELITTEIVREYKTLHIPEDVTKQIVEKVKENIGKLKEIAFNKGDISGDEDEPEEIDEDVVEVFKLSKTTSGGFGF